MPVCVCVLVARCFTKRTRESENHFCGAFVCFAFLSKRGRRETTISEKA